MERERYNSIYEYYSCHILIGHLEEGSYLPTIEQICGIFQVAPETVRSALIKLQDDGLVNVSAGRRTIVTYAASSEEKHRFAEHYYLSRKETLENIYQVTELILMPLFREGCQRLSDDELLCISRAIKQGTPNFASISRIYCNAMILKLNNRLAKDLFFDILSFFQFPCLTFSNEQEEEYRQNYCLLLSCCEASDRDGLFRAFSYLQSITRKTILDFIDKAALNWPALPQISFHWQTNRDRPQHCHSLASQIIRYIINGRYCETDMLPSYEKMAEEFSVSVSTIRRTIKLLHDMGVLRSINGVGSQILFAEPNWTRLKRPVIQNSITRAKESVTFFSLTAETVLLRILPSLTSSQINTIKYHLTEKQGTHPLSSLLRVSEYISSTYPYPLLSEIYGKLSEFLLFVYPLLASCKRGEDFKTFSIIKEMELALERNNPASFYRGFSSLLESAREELSILERHLMR